MFAILVLMALFTTFITTPIVMAIFKPDSFETQKRKLQPDASVHMDSSTTPATSAFKEQFRVLACAHGPGNVSGLINLIESTRSTASKNNLKLYIMHLVELTERSSSILMVHRLRRNGFPFIDPTRHRSQVEVHDRVASAFETYAQLGRVMVRPVTTVSPLSTMHEDVRHVAEGKRVMMIIMPFHMMWRKDEESGKMKLVENLGHGWRGVNQRLLKNAPCTVSVFVDRGFGAGCAAQDDATSQRQLRFCVEFFGGADDREALELGARMMDHPEIRVTIIRFVQSQGMDANNVKLMPSSEKCSDSNYTFSVAAINRTEETALNEAMVEIFRNKWDGTMEFIQKQANNIEEAVLTLGRSGEYDLIVVGKGRFPSTMVAELADRQAEHAELGPIGDILSSTNNGIVSSVLVIQQHASAHVEEMPVDKVVEGDVNVQNAANQV
uniref:Uncharacterized protein n=2 Tax=Chenopodium quinoa TaxID=63459 RepID=A0A803N7K1_CHEQI